MPDSQFGKINKKQKEILKLLSDGLMHRRSEIHAIVLQDSSDSPQIVYNNISNLRKLMVLKGQDIACRLVGYRIYYQHIIMLPNANDGTR